MAFELTVIMYHYVRDAERTPYPRINALPVERFREHLDRLAAQYSFVGAEDVLRAVRGEVRLPERSCLLTFDDGFRDHAENVFPLLRERGIPGLFFLITAAPEEGRVADVHKVHFLLAQLGTERMVEKFHSFASRSCPERANELRVDDRERKSPSRYDDILTGNLKVTISRLNEPTRSSFLMELFSETFGDERAFARDLYLSWDDANAMIAGGMEIGSHGHTHRLLSLLSPDEQEKDILEARDLLALRTNGAALPAISYPFGPAGESVLEIAGRLGYSLGFTVEVGINVSLRDPLHLKRMNANDVLSL